MGVVVDDNIFDIYEILQVHSKLLSSERCLLSTQIFMSIMAKGLCM
jgi:hypothetical protein